LNILFEVFKGLSQIQVKSQVDKIVMPDTLKNWVEYIQSG